MSKNQGALLIRHGAAHWHAPQLYAYADEDDLKHMLREAPQLLTVCTDQAVFVDELTVPGIGSADLAGVGPDGDITLVECKLKANPEIRREIVGQIFAYAAGLWRMRYDEFERYFNDRLKNGATSLADAVRLRLPESERANWDEQGFRANVADNLTAGRFTLVIAVDCITDELKRVVPYVNEHTLSEVRFLALEMRCAKDERTGVEIALPAIYGEESANEKQITHRRSWSADAYRQKVTEYGGAVRSAIDRLISFSESNGARLAGGTGEQPSLNVRFPVGGRLRTVWSSYLQSAGPTFDLNLEYLRDTVAHERLRHAAEIMASIDGAAARYTQIDPEFRARPSLPIAPALTYPVALEKVERVLTLLVDRQPDAPPPQIR